MDIKTTFSKQRLTCSKQPESSKLKGQEHLVSKSMKSIYGLKQTSKCDEILMQFFSSRIKWIYVYQPQDEWEQLMLTCPYIDDTLLISICYISQIISHTYFDIMNLGNTTYVRDIKIYQDRPIGALVSCHKLYSKVGPYICNKQYCSH